MGAFYFKIEETSLTQHYTADQNNCIYSLFTWSKQKWLFWKAAVLSSQSEQLKKYSKSSDWLEKTGPPKKPLLFWSCKQANKALIFRLFKRTQIDSDSFNSDTLDKRATLMTHNFDYLEYLLMSLYGETDCWGFE